MPLGALVDDGKDSVVFVPSDANGLVFSMRRVKVTDRFERTAYIRSVPAAKDADLAAGQEAQAGPPTEPLREGERMLTTGALELKAALENKLANVVNSEEAKCEEAKSL